ncbi:hypothetical protein EV178_003328 [Coemansia sp. RSA 1646]|nr:hypothetical protein EV178_003328 [Coemansia sp. RSA 1646]KAJ1774092.1 hypothetical protein LPJ74_000191 [Coemansia sp. RSA 1843]KAJ2216788.1 hypothetical protein EV179_001078 [Coemansia sp. RSA 487]
MNNMTPMKLQTLPKHIAQRIAFKAAQWRTADIDEALLNISNPAWKMVNYLALCQSWRYHCIPLYCQDMLISLNRAFSAIQDTHYWLTTMDDVLRLSGQRYTRNVHLHVPLSQVLNGEFPGFLLKPPYRDAVFPNVSVVWFKLHIGGELTGMLNGESIKYIDSFVVQIKQMFPNAQIYSISSSVALAADEKEILNHCDYMFSKLMTGIRGIKYYTASEHFVATPVPTITGLTRISYYECESPAQFLQLICNNQKTLVILNLELSKPNTLVQMFQTDRQASAEGQPGMSFPQLQRLEVICHNHNQLLMDSRTHVSGVPFPSLRRLRFHHPYPFSGDELFRGNHDKLEHLSLSIDAEDIVHMLQSGAFKKGKFSTLKFIDLDIDLSQALVDHAYGKQLCHTLWHLAPEQENLSVNLISFAYKEEFIQELEPGQHTGLRFLSIGSLDLDIWETIRILGQLPQLSQLEINPKTMDLNKPWYIQNLITTTYLDDLVREFYPLAPWLRYILFDLSLYSDMEGASHFAVQLAILCPKVDCVRWGMHSTAFERCCKTLAASAEYFEYSDRLALVDWSKKS